MTRSFADTFYFLELLNSDDPAHQRSSEFADSYRGEIVTTGWVLVEVADAMSHPTNRQLVVDFLAQLRAAPRTTIVPFSDALADEGLRLFAARQDKHWSLTDCISFVVMQREGITEALTGDRHFEQAGFRALLV
jgi:predicted nucleic acid-binding protein